MKNIFDLSVTEEIVQRIEKLQPDTQRLWGIMDVAQMLAHCNVAFSYTFSPDKFKKPNFLMRFLLKNFIKKSIVSPKPYRHNERTAPYFLIADQREFEKEKKLLIENIRKTQQLGESYFDGLENFSFGKMTAQEWSTMYYKHLDHHLRQFGV